MLSKWIIEKLGGWTDAHSFLKSLSRNDREQILTEAVAHLFSTIGPDDILRFTPEGWKNGDKILHPEQMKLLAAQANQLLNMELWKILQKDAAYQANLKMFRDSQDVMDITAGKLLLYLQDVFKTRLEKLSKL